MVTTSVLTIKYTETSTQMRREESSEKDISSGHGIKENSTVNALGRRRGCQETHGTWFSGCFALLSQISFFLCKPCIAWRGKILQFFLRKEEFLIYLPLNVIMSLLPYLDQYLLNRFDQPKAKGTCRFCCVCNRKKKKVQISTFALLQIFRDIP